VTVTRHGDNIIDATRLFVVFMRSTARRWNKLLERENSMYGWFM
jgi:hypothetical protein